MKTKKGLVGLFVLSVVIFLAGCGSSFASSPAYPMPSAHLNMGCTNATGTYTIIGTAMQQVFSANSPGFEITAQVTDGSQQNMQLLGAGDLELAMSSSFQINEATYQLNPAYSAPIKSLALIAFNTGYVHLVAREGSGINGFADLPGKRVSTLEPGGNQEGHAFCFFEGMGIDWTKDFSNWARIGLNDASDAIADGRLDAYTYMGGVPVTRISELVQDGRGKPIPMEQEAIDFYCKRYPFAYSSTIPVGVYGNDKPIPAVASTNVIVVREDFPDDQAYWIVKTLYENFEQWRNCHGSVRDFFVDGIEAAIVGLPVDLHPGALKYYQEVGLIK